MSSLEQPGWIYCLSNPTMPEIYKIGLTTRTPEERLSEANASPDIPTPYKLEFARKVSDVSSKERNLHTILEMDNERVNPKREFFQTNLERIRMLFNLMDGEWWVPCEEDDTSSVASPQDSSTGRRVGLSRYFTDGQRIRHQGSCDTIWIGTFDASTNTIKRDGKSYRSLSSFAGEHYRQARDDRNPNTNGWTECYCEVNGEWIKADSVRQQANMSV